MKLTWHFSARLKNCSVPDIFFFQLYLDILVKSTLNLLCERLIRLGCVSLSLEGMVGFVGFFFFTTLKSYRFPYGLTSVEIYASLEFGCIFQLL